MDSMVNRLKEYGRELSILLVDDDFGARESISRLLENFFGEVFVAEDGKSGLNIFKEKKPDIVFTDLKMPGISGLQMIEKIRDIEANQKIIVQSAYSESNIMLKAITLGVDGYILKPVDSKKIISVLHKVAKSLDMQKQNDEYRLKLEGLVKKQVKKIKDQTQIIINQLKIDNLTKLPNKAQLDFDFANEMPTHMIYINIDNFDEINLYYGFEVGDKLLKEFTNYLKKRFEFQKLYRINGDEFAFLLHYCSSDEEALEFARRVNSAIYGNCFNIDNFTLCITVSIGVIPIDSSSKTPPYSNAHLTIKKAREFRKNSIELFLPEYLLELKQKKSIEWTQRAKIALDLDMYEPFFQPIVDLKSKKVQKYESLARMIDVDKIISPFFFIEPARKAGLLPSLTRLIIEKSFAKMSNSSIDFSINISDVDLKEGYLLDFLQKQCKMYKVEPSRVVLEILENIQSSVCSVQIVEQLKELKRLGFKIAVDDFGADSSNFARLQKLDIDFIKIDGSFIKEIDKNEESLNIVKTIVYYAKLSNIKTIAEFVHSKEVANIVEEIGVDFAQGYYFGKPEPRL